MDSITIDSGIKRLSVNGDPNRIITFNPNDVLFAEKFYGLIRSFETEEKRFTERVEAIKASETLDEHGISTNAHETFALVEEVCNFLRAKIDEVFGAGTSQAAFGDAQVLGMFEQFFLGVASFIQEARSAKVGKYQRKPKSPAQ